MTLYLPKFCLVPLAARLDTTLCDAAKIYLGELNVLTNRYGYCFASDEELAEMKQVSLRTIKNWHQQLEDRDFIRRDTTREHYKEEGSPGVKIRSKRKIYILDKDSNNVAEGQNSAPRSEGQNSAPRSEGQNSAPISKEPLNTKQMNDEKPDHHHHFLAIASPEPEPEPEPVADVPDCLGPFIPHLKASELQDLCRQFAANAERVDWACKQFLDRKYSMDNPYSMLLKIVGSWRPTLESRSTAPAVSQECQEKNRADARTFVEKTGGVFFGVKVAVTGTHFVATDGKTVRKLGFDHEDFDREIFSVPIGLMTPQQLEIYIEHAQHNNRP